MIGSASGSPLLEDPFALLALLFCVLAAVFALAGYRRTAPFFKIVPALSMCYFVPMGLTAAGVIPAASPLYAWVKQYILPASLLLLCLSLDIREIIRLGPKAVITMLAGTVGVVVGGPVALLICKSHLPADAWKPMAALAGSWIGGGANMIAVQQSVGVSDAMIGPIIVVDTVMAGLWMGVLFFLAGRQQSIDRRLRAETGAIDRLRDKMQQFRAAVARIPNMTDLLIILALAFAATVMSARIGAFLDRTVTGEDGTLATRWGWTLHEIVSADTWKIVIVTAFGIALSLTPARRLEGCGASTVGSLMLYVLVACIGAGADLHGLLEAPWFVIMGLIWLGCHAVVLLLVVWLIRAPLFFMAVGSMANIGGAASAPVVASAFHPALAPVGVLLAVAGYAIGTYAALICAALMRNL